MIIGAGQPSLFVSLFISYAFDLRRVAALFGFPFNRRNALRFPPCCLPQRPRGISERVAGAVSVRRTLAAGSVVRQLQTKHCLWVKDWSSVCGISCFLMCLLGYNAVSKPARFGGGRTVDLENSWQLNVQFKNKTKQNKWSCERKCEISL